MSSDSTLRLTLNLLHDFEPKPCVMGSLANMSQATENADDDVHQDVLGQFRFLDGYTHVICGFQTVYISRVVSSLPASVAELCAKIPWLGWRVTTTSGNGKMQEQPRPKSRETPYEMIRVKE